MSPLLPGAKKHNVSHPEELTLSFLSLHDGVDCCILPEKAKGPDGTEYEKGAMVEEGWGGSLLMPEGSIQAHCCHGTISVPLEGDIRFSDVESVSYPITTTKSTYSTTSTTSTTTYSPGCGPDDRTVVSGDIYDSRFTVDKLYTDSKKDIMGKTYWLGKNGQKAIFVLNLGCLIRFNGIQLVNTHNQGNRDRSTKRFRLSVSQSQAGPWQNVLETTLVDSRRQNDPLPLQLINLQAEATGQFLKFELLEWYGLGGGLQYFDIQRGN